MSKVTRYTSNAGPGSLAYIPAEKGEFVTYKSYRALQRKYEQLKAEVDCERRMGNMDDLGYRL